MCNLTWSKSPDSIGWIITALVVIIGIALGAYVIWWKQESPTLGDWGSCLGGVFAALAFVWLIIGHLYTQRRIEEGQKDVVSQMKLTQDVVASLARLAMSHQLHDAAKMAEMLPVFVEQDSQGTTQGANIAMVRPLSWHTSFRNEGMGVKLTRADSETNEVVISIEQLGDCPRGGMFVVNFKSSTPINCLGPLKCILFFDDHLSRTGHALISVNTVDGSSNSQVKMGLPS